jgi:hypothetical protein
VEVHGASIGDERSSRFILQAELMREIVAIRGEKMASENSYNRKSVKSAQSMVFFMVHIASGRGTHELYFF